MADGRGIGPGPPWPGDHQHDPLHDDTPDTLRDQFALALRDHGMMLGDADQVDAVMAVLADPTNLRGVLGLLGLNTREGWLNLTPGRAHSWEVLSQHVSTPPEFYDAFMDGKVLVVELPSDPATKEADDG